MHKQRFFIKRFPIQGNMQKQWLSPKLIASIIGILSFIGLAILTGVVGNRADAIFIWFWSILTAKQAADVWLWIVTIVSSVSFLVIWLIWLQSRFSSHRKLVAFAKELHAKEKMLGLDDSLLRLITSLIRARDVDTEIHRVIQKLLYDATQLFTSNIRRGLLLRPDTAREYLLIWDHYGWLDEEDQKKFYIGPTVPGWQRGIAGEAFFNSTITTAHILEESNKTWKCDRESYVSFAENNAIPSHRSLICVPVVVGADANDRLGVICFDSTDVRAFDSVEIEEMLQLLSRRIAAVLLAYQELQNIRSTWKSSE